MERRGWTYILFLCVTSFVALSRADGDTTDQYDNQLRPPLARFVQPPDDVLGIFQDGEATTVEMTTREQNGVSSLTEAIVLAVMSGIMGPSLIALVGCSIRQYRLTKDDPFAGGERPVDEAKERKRRKQQQREAAGDDNEDEMEYVNSRRAYKVPTNNNSLNLDRSLAVDLEAIRIKHLPNTNKSGPKGKNNMGFSKTAEDIL